MPRADNHIQPRHTERANLREKLCELFLGVLHDWEVLTEESL